MLLCLWVATHVTYDNVSFECLFVISPVSCSVIKFPSFFPNLVVDMPGGPSSEMALFRGAPSGHRIHPISPTPQTLVQAISLASALTFPSLFKISN